MSKIRLRFLGGLEVWAGERQIAGLESGKARSLLAYLVCNRRRTFPRDHLAGLLWPEQGGEAARQALHQALQDLRSTLPDGGALLQATDLEVGLVPRADLWLDVEAFEESLRLGSGQAVDPQYLAAAVQLYRGEFLAGSSGEGSPGLAGWIATERARLRDAAAGALHRLIEGYRRRGEHWLGAHYAQRLMAIEPRAESRQLYESILAAAREGTAAGQQEEPVGPIIPLAGRAGAYVQLLAGWARTLAGKAHTTVILGERGSGKTRLVKSFLDAATSKQPSGVLQGGCHELSPLLAYRPFVEMLRDALTEEAEGSGQALASVPDEALEDLARLVPELRNLRPDLPEPAPLAGSAGRERLFTAVRLFLESRCRSGEPLILFLDDLHLADRDTLDLLGFLVAKLTGPVWIIAAFQPAEMEGDHPLGRILLHGEQEGSVTRLELEPLVLPMLEEIAGALVGEPQAAELAGFLAQRSAGLPLVVTELVNYLWDEGILVAQGAGRWKLARALREVEVPEDLDELIQLRIARLPNSTRRLAYLAAVLGQTFEAQLLQEAADEHARVVEIGLEILLKRWLIQYLSCFWPGRRSDGEPVVVWMRGGRRGLFELAHDRIREAIYGELNPLRRQAMHAQVAAALEKLRGDRDCETLAFHYTLANQWEKALPHLRRSIERALAVGAADAAQRYCDQALAGLSRLAAGARSEAAAERWREEREELREKAAKLWP